MAYVVRYESNTVRFKLYYTGDVLDKVKLHMNRRVNKEELYEGLKFLKKLGLKTNRRHEGRRDYEDWVKYQGYIGEINEIQGLTLILNDGPQTEEITISHSGLVDNNFDKLNGLNHMIDLMVTLYGYYNQVN